VSRYQANRRAAKHLVIRLIEYPANPVESSEEQDDDNKDSHSTGVSLE
jgi:hypothetical protein